MSVRPCMKRTPNLRMKEDRKKNNKNRQQQLKSLINTVYTTTPDSHFLCFIKEKKRSSPSLPLLFNYPASYTIRNDPIPLFIKMLFPIHSYTAYSNNINKTIKLFHPENIFRKINKTQSKNIQNENREKNRRGGMNQQQNITKMKILLNTTLRHQAFIQLAYSSHPAIQRI